MEQQRSKMNVLVTVFSVYLANCFAFLGSTIFPPLDWVHMDSKIVWNTYLYIVESYAQWGHKIMKNVTETIWDC